MEILATPLNSTTSTNATTIAQNNLPAIQDFLSDWHVRTTWIAFITLWIIWGFAWFVRNAFGGDGEVIQSTAQISHDETNYTVDPQTGATTHNKVHLAAPSWSLNVFNRLNRAHDLLRDLVLMLLSILVLNTFGRASTRAAMVIAWFFTALGIATCIIEAGYTHRYLRLLYTAAFFGLALAIVGITYVQGFY
ncbi:hypothetical protein K501DRAFT_174207 [Backusella circina FSU 941]|nr:hypothetical protein K501DRAFT_174207 [Backusella circina FSU 941]